MSRDLRHLPLCDIDHLDMANFSNLDIVFYLLGDFGQALFIRSCLEDLILTRKSHNCSVTAFVHSGDSAGGSKLIKRILLEMMSKYFYMNCKVYQ